MKSGVLKNSNNKLFVEPNNSINSNNINSNNNDTISNKSHKQVSFKNLPKNNNSKNTIQSQSPSSKNTNNLVLPSINQSNNNSNIIKDSKKEDKNNPYSEENLVLNKFNKGNMLVVVRKRPLNKRELTYNTVDLVKIVGEDQVSVLDTNYASSANQNKTTMPKNQHFFYDYAFDENSSQEEVYKKTTKFLLQGVLEGYNATVLAYGATGCGKTYTMVGSDSNEGIMVRSVADLFELKEKVEALGNDVKISMTYVEVYNENILDLMTDKKDSAPLELFEDSSKKMIINGVTEIFVNNSNEVFKLLVRGNKNRTEDSTESNQFSSRSHGILIINVETIMLSQKGKRLAGKFILVDLAGSEKASYHKVKGKRTIEGGNINKSLLALSNCINGLADKKSFIPWRYSKLTRLLQDSIGGNSRLVLIINISGSILNYDETLYSLKYGNRAKNIKREVTQNFLPDVKVIEKYENVMSIIKDEIEEAKSKLRERQSSSGLFSTQKNHEFNQENNDSIENLQNKINNHFQKEIILKKEIINLEKEIEDLKLKTAEGYIQIAKDKSQAKLATQINNYEDEKEKLSDEVAKKFSDLSNLKAQRKVLLQEIKTFSAKETSYKLLNDYYNYYIVYLENMNFTHREFINNNQIAIQQLQIKELILQLQYRDVALQKIKGEYTKKNLHFKPENVRDYEDFSQEPLMLPSININNFEIGGGNLMNNQGISGVESILKNKEEGFRGKDFRPLNSEANNNIKRINPRLNVNNSRMSNLSNKKIPIRSFNYELSSKRSVKKINQPMKLNPSKFSMKFNDFNRDIPISKFNSSMNNSKYFSNNNSFNRSNNSYGRETSDSSKFKKSDEVFDVFDKQRKNMVKTILRKNIMGRFRGSPYLKNY